MKSEHLKAIAHAEAALNHPESRKSYGLKRAITETITLFLTSEGLHFEQQEDDVFFGKVSSDVGMWDCYIQAMEDRQQLLIYSVLPFELKEHQLEVVTELITRINYGLIIGNFDIAQNMIAYKTSLDIEGSNLDIPLINRLFYSNVVSVNRYLPAICALLEGTLSPKQAIALVEGELN